MAALPSTIASFADVTCAIRLSCKDIVDSVVESTFSRRLTQGHTVDQSLVLRWEAIMWRRVFRPTEGPAWNSNLPVPDPRLPSKLTPFDLRVPAGTLLVDAAPPDTNRRLFPWTVRMLDPPAVGARRGGQEVFLEPRQGPNSDDKIQWFWTDKDGKAVDPRITLIHVINGKDVINQFRHFAVQHKDRTLFSHALKHNTEVGIYRMRCQLSALTASRSSQEPRPPLPSIVNGEDLAKPSYMMKSLYRELSAGPNPDAEAQARRNAAQVLMLYFYHHCSRTIWV
ncbi:unnamed protein product [Clonostachys rosea]|uniref:Uncharacterized protein n=1 Tax=Bionectria ochroleuca TaxID=29856 RepID=A0ABY6U076_BIOOC|nr:unnamed protein product [Clonostachys rosea]